MAVLSVCCRGYTVGRDWLVDRFTMGVHLAVISTSTGILVIAIATVPWAAQPVDYYGCLITAII